MDDSSGLKELPVAFQEKRTRQAAVLTLKLGIRERQPNLTDLPRPEESLDELNPCTKERDILESLLSRRLGSPPESRPLDVNSDVVTVRNPLRQVDRVLSLPTAKLQDYRLVLPEHRRIPVTLYRMVMKP